MRSRLHTYINLPILLLLLPLLAITHPYLSTLTAALTAALIALLDELRY
jgi:hypothetical protein